MHKLKTDIIYNNKQMENIEPAFIETVALTEIGDEIQPNSLILLLIFVLSLVIAYIVPMIANVFSKNNAKKWVLYWLFLLSGSYFSMNILDSIFNAYSTGFLFLIFSGWLLIISNKEKSRLLVRGCEICINWEYSSVKSGVLKFLRFFYVKVDE